MNLFKNKTLRSNEIAMIYGILSFSIVYMHTNSIDGAIDPYSLNQSYPILTNILHMLFSTSVPAFFILWGYLSHKYLCDDSTRPLQYLKSKIIHFWPIYISFSILYIANIAFRHDIRDLLPIHSLILSILGFGDFFGSHIMVPLFLSLIAVSALKCFRNNQWILVLYFSIIFIYGNFLPDHPSNLLFANLFFHTAFCLGMIIKEYDLLIFKSSNVLNILLCVFGGVIYLTAVMGWDFFFTRFPNSYGHLIITTSVLIVGYNAICIIFSNTPQFIKQVLCTIGNFAFAHMIIHIHVMNLFNTVGSEFLIHPVMVQIVSISTTSIISIYIIFPIYNYLEITVLKQ